MGPGPGGRQGSGHREEALDQCWLGVCLETAQLDQPP